MSSVQKDLGEIIEAVREEGFDVVSADGHHKVYYEGRPVLFEEVPGDASSRVPVTMPGTPSDARWRENLVSLLVRAKVLKADPKRAGQNGLTDEDLARRAAEEERKARNRASAQAMQAIHEDRQAQTNALRERAEKVFGRLGTWKAGTRGGSTTSTTPRRSVTEVARVAYHWSGSRDDLPRPASMNAGEQAVRIIHNGGSVGEDTQAWFGAFVDAVEAAEDPHAFYFGLLREHLGLSDEPDAEPQVEPEPEPRTEPAGPEPLRPEDEDDLRIRDLRERLEEARADAESLQSDLAKTGADLAAAEAALAESREEASRAWQQATEAQAEAQKGPEPKVPELAHRALAEMLGQHVTVAGEDAGDLSGILQMAQEKKERALAIAREIAELELGIRR